MLNNFMKRVGFRRKSSSEASRLTGKAVVTAEEGRYVQIRWPEDISTENYMAAYREALELALKHKVRVLLLDQTDLQTVESRARVWLLSQFVPEMKRRMGDEQMTLVVILAKSRYTQVLTKGLTGLVANVISGLKLHQFEEADEARAFIASLEA